MVDVAGVVGSSRRLEESVDFLGRTPSVKNKWDTSLLSDIIRTKAIFISIDGIEYDVSTGGGIELRQDGVATKEFREKILKGEWEFPTYFLMPENILLKKWLKLNQLWEVRKNLDERGIDYATYVCAGKPYIPTGDIFPF